MKKKVLSLILVMTILIGAFPTTVNAAASNDYTQWRQGDAAWNQAEAWPASQYPSATMRYMRQAGCLVTSIAMLLRQYNVVTDSNVNNFNPWICNEQLKAAGAFTPAADLRWADVQKAYPGFVYAGSMSYSASNLVSLYNQGYACVVGVNNNGHYVAVRSASDASNIVIMDPGWGYTSLASFSSVNSIYYYKATSSDTTPPSISNVSVSNITSKGYTITCTVTDNTGIDRVQFPTWTTYNGQDDLAAYWMFEGSCTGTKNGNTYSFNVSISDHNNEHGEYVTHIYAYDTAGNSTTHNISVVTVPQYDIVTIEYNDENGVNWGNGYYEINEECQIMEEYPKADGKYFCGWSYTQGSTKCDVLPGETITLTGNISLYPVYVTFEQAVSGEVVYIYNINDFTEEGYDISTKEQVIETYVDNSYWTDWSGYGLTPIEPSSTVEVRTTPMYRYYFYLCPSCGAHEPYYGRSDCGATIPSTSVYAGWSTTPYSQSNYQAFSYTNQKYYTTSLEDGQMWIFSSGNVNDTAVGTLDSDSTEVVIATGYSSRNYVEQIEVIRETKTGYVITRKPVTLNSLEFLQLPYKLVFEQGEIFDISGMVLVAYYSDGTVEQVVEDFEITGVDTSIVGTQNVKISYNGLSISYDITVEAREYTVTYDANGGSGAPDKQIKTGGIDLILSSTVPTRDGYIFLGWSRSSSATEVSFAAGGIFDINADMTLYAVWEKNPVTLSSINIESMPAKTTYHVGDTLDTSGLQLKLTYSDGTTEYVTSGFTTSGFDSSTAGEKKVTISYGEKTTSFNVTVEEVVDETASQIIVESKAATAGETVQITVALENNPGIAGLAISLNYDESVLTLKETENGSLFSGFTAAKNFAWDESRDVLEDGVLATFTFEVAEDAKAGDYNIEVLVRSCTNENLDDVELLTTSGKVSVINFLYGDANGDQKIDMKDVVLIRKYITNFDYDTNTSSVNVTLGADANGDNKIDMKDVVILRKYITNYDYDTESSTVVLGPQ